MQRRFAIHPFFAWALMALLLFKAAVPGVAAAAAQTRGAALVEVCTVYGVRTFSVDADGLPVDAARLGTPASDEPAAAGGAEGCALASLPAFDLPLPALRHAPEEAMRPEGAATYRAPLPPDASRAWWAGLKQGPPQS